MLLLVYVVEVCLCLSELCCFILLIVEDHLLYLFDWKLEDLSPRKLSMKGFIVAFCI